MSLIQIHEPGQTPMPHEDTAAVGIDLGTTHSVVAVASHGKVEVLRDLCGGTLTPSVVHYLSGGGVEVGKTAHSRLIAGEKKSIASIKRLMGKGAEEARGLLQGLPYTLADGSDGKVSLTVADMQVTPVEVSAEILKHLKTLATQALGKDVSQAVITVPAYFDESARQATKDAARLAGLEVLRLISEPTAAALAYGLDTGAEGIYAIYDLGGGTFDISLLKMEKGVFQVLATGGDTALGGDDIDHAIVKHWVQQHTLALTTEEEQRLHALARAVKEQLSSADIAYETLKRSQEDVECSLTREALDVLAASLIGRSISICEKVVRDVRITKEEIKGVVLVGGSTRMPLVKQKVSEFFGTTPLDNVNPDEVVAVGAALQAEGLTQGSDNLLLDVIPLSLGLETMGGIVEKIIHRNTPIPVAVSQEFTTYQDGQTAMVVHVLQGEREMVGDCRSLSRFVLGGIPPMVAAMARIKVTFTVDADGLLTVSAREETTGTEQVVQVKPTYGLEEGDIERMLRESMEYAKADILGRLLAEAKMEARRSVLEVESALRADGQLLNEVEKSLIAKKIQEVNLVMAGDDRDAVDAAVQQLHHTTRDFAERRMDKAIGAALKGTHVDNFSA